MQKSTQQLLSNSNNALDQVDDTREIPLNGFNRFDPKYISIGPKALRDSTFGSQNKCATLRQGGRFGGSLSNNIERGTYSSGPTLKRAPPPNVSTVYKDPNDIITANAAATIKATNEILAPSKLLTSFSSTNNNNTINNNNNNVNIGSNVKSDNSIKNNNTVSTTSGYETDSGDIGGRIKKNSLQFNDSVNTKRDNTSTSYESRHMQSSVYSIQTATYRPPAKLPSAQQQQNRKIVQQSPQTQIKQPPRPAKSPNTRSSVPIFNQPLPEIPQQAQTTTRSAQQQHQQHEINRNVQQPLSAANLNNYRSLKTTTNDMNTFDNIQISGTGGRDIHQISSMNSKPNIPLPPKQHQQPPMLPPKNRQRDHPQSQHILDGSATLTRKNNNLKQQHATDFGTNTLPSKSSQRNAALNTQNALNYKQSTSTVYSTFGYDDKKRYPQYQHNHESSQQQQQYPSETKTLGRQQITQMQQHQLQQQLLLQQQQQQQQHKTKDPLPRERDRNQAHHHSNRQHQYQQQQQQQQQYQQQLQQSYSNKRNDQSYYRSMQRGGSGNGSGLTGTNYFINL